MTTNRTLRLLFILIISYLAWRTCGGLSREVWWIMSVTAAFWLILGICVYFVVRWTKPERTTNYPSTVRSRIRDGLRKGSTSEKE